MKPKFKLPLGYIIEREDDRNWVVKQDLGMRAIGKGKNKGKEVPVIKELAFCANLPHAVIAVTTHLTLEKQTNQEMFTKLKMVIDFYHELQKDMELLKSI